MCSTARLHAIFKQESNSVDSNHFKDFPPAFIDDMLYRGYLDLIDSAIKMGGPDLTQLLMDTFSVLVRSKNLVIASPSVAYRGGFKTVCEYPDDYYYHLTGEINTDCGTVTFSSIQHQKKSYYLGNEMVAPSDRWSRAYALYGEQITLYTENAITAAELTYLKEPTRPFFGGYNSLEFIEGDSTAPRIGDPAVDTEIRDGHCQKLVRRAIAIIKGDPFYEMDLVNQRQNKNQQ